MKIAPALKTGLHSIRNDHTLFRTNFDRLLRETNLAAKTALFNDTIKAMAQHDVAEEVVLYPAIRNLGLGEMADLALQQTRDMERLLYDMDQKYGSGIDDNAAFNAYLTRLRDTFEMHGAGLEESKLLPTLEQNLSLEDIESLNQWIERIKPLAPTRPHPDGPQFVVGQLFVGPVVSFIDRFRDMSKTFNP